MLGPAITNNGTLLTNNISILTASPQLQFTLGANSEVAILSLANTGVTAGTYNTIEVNAAGQVISATNISYLLTSGGTLTGALIGTTASFTSLTTTSISSTGIVSGASGSFSGAITTGSLVATAINSTPIGATTASTGKFTSLTASTGTFSGAVSVTGVLTAASPSLTGVPIAPTAAFRTNTTQIATTAFVQQAAGNYTSTINYSATAGTFVATQSGSMIEITGTIIPGASVVSAVGNSGRTFTFYNNSLNNFTATSLGGLFSGPVGSGASTLSLPVGGVVEIISDGTNWIAVDSAYAGNVGPWLPLTGGTLSGALVGTTALLSNSLTSPTLNLNGNSTFGINFNGSNAVGISFTSASLTTTVVRMNRGQNIAFEATGILTLSLSSTSNTWQFDSGTSVALAITQAGNVNAETSMSAPSGSFTNMIVSTSLSTSQNILDDGSGNVTIAGTLNVNQILAPSGSLTINSMTTMGTLTVNNINIENGVSFSPNTTIINTTSTGTYINQGLIIASDSFGGAAIVVPTSGLDIWTPDSTTGTLINTLVLHNGSVSTNNQVLDDGHGNASFVNVTINGTLVVPNLLYTSTIISINDGGAGTIQIVSPIQMDSSVVITSGVTISGNLDTSILSANEIDVAGIIQLVSGSVVVASIDAGGGASFITVMASSGSFSSLTINGAAALTANQPITISGDASGSGATAIALTLANTGVTAGTYNNVVVNAKGLVTSASNTSYLSSAGGTISGALTVNGASTFSGSLSATSITTAYLSVTNTLKVNATSINFYPGTTPTTGTYSPNGLTVGWNTVGGDIALFLGPQAGGTGGLTMYQLTNTGTLLSTTPIFAVNRTGNLTIPGTFTAPTIDTTNIIPTGISGVGFAVNLAGSYTVGLSTASASLTGASVRMASGQYIGFNAADGFRLGLDTNNNLGYTVAQTEVFSISGSGLVSASSGTFSGALYAATASYGTNNTQVATTAFVTSKQGNYESTIFYSATVGTFSNTGNFIEITGTIATAASVLSASGIPGQNFCFYNNSTNSFTATSLGGLFDGPFGSGASMLSIPSGGVTQITSDGTNWIVGNISYNNYSTFLCDEFVGGVPGAVYSLRQLTSTYYGPCLRIRRDTDNLQQDIGFSNGIVNIKAALSFVGTANGYAVIWYNQGVLGSSANLTQVTSNFQPQLIASGTLQTVSDVPALYFGAWSTCFFTLPASVTPVNAVDINMVVTAPSASAGANIGLIYFGASNGLPIIWVPGGGTALQFQNFLTTMPYQNSPFSVLSSLNGSSQTQTAYINQTNIYTGSYSYSPTAAAGRVGEGAATGYWKGWMHEIIITPGTNLLLSDRNNLQANQTSYFNSFLPSTGGTLSGTLVGTSASFSGSLVTNSLNVSGNIVLNAPLDLSRINLRTTGDNNHALFYSSANVSTTWLASTVYAVNTIIVPSANNSALSYQCTTAGTSGTTQPTWTSYITPGTFVTDGSCVWTPYENYFAGVGIDGPVLTGYTGGALGTFKGQTTGLQSIALSWNGKYVSTTKNVLDDGSGNMTVAGQLLALNSEAHFAASSFTDPESGVTRDAKFGHSGIAVIGGIYTDTITASSGTFTNNVGIGGTLSVNSIVGITDAPYIEYFGGSTAVNFNNATAISNALSQGYPVIFGPGTYYVGDIVVSSNAVFKGIPGNTVIKRISQSGTIWIDFTASNVYIDNIIFDGNTSNTVSSYGVVIDSTVTTSVINNSQFINNKVSNGANEHGLTYISSGATAVVSHCVSNTTFANNGFHGIAVGIVNNINIDNCIAYGNHLDGIHVDGDINNVTPSKDVIINNCTTYSNGNNGIQICYVKNGSLGYYSYTSPAVIGAVVSRNKSYSNGAYGIYVGTLKNGIVVNNVINDNNYGNLLGDCAYYTKFNNNTVYGTGTFGIDAACGYRCEVNDNIVTGSAAIGINIGGSTNTRCSRNFVSSFTGFGICVENIEGDGSNVGFGTYDTETIISENVIDYSNGAYAIEIADNPTAILVENNRFFSTSDTNGLNAVDDVSTSTVYIGNTINNTNNPTINFSTSGTFVIPPWVETVLINPTAANLSVSNILYPTQTRIGTGIAYTTITTGGSGYTTTTGYTVTGGSGSGASYSAFPYNNAVYGLRMSANGTGYGTIGSTVSLTITNSNGGSGATATGYVGLPWSTNRQIQINNIGSYNVGIVSNNISNYTLGTNNIANIIVSGTYTYCDTISYSEVVNALGYTPLSTSGGTISGSLVATSVNITAAATLASQAVRLDQVQGAFMNVIQLTTGTAANTTYTATYSFSVVSAGTALFMGSWEGGNSSALLGGGAAATEFIKVDGASALSAGATGNAWHQPAAVSLASGNHTAVIGLTTGTATLTGPIYCYLSVIFMPTIT